MKRSKLFGYLVPIIFLAAFNAIFFIVGGEEHPVSVWVAYGAIHFTYIMTVLTPMFTYKGKHFMEVGAPVAVLSFANFVVHFVLGLIIFAVAPGESKFLWVLYIILFAVYFMLFFSLMSVNAHTEASEKRQTAEISYIRNSASRVKMLIGRASTQALNKQIEKVYDNLHASPTRTNAAAASIESSIVLKIGELESAVRSADDEKASAIANELVYLIDERNRLIQINY